jgi:predicted transcriptional regulator
MSIHPRYADAIMDGRKEVEFRKRSLAPDIETVWVYATVPVQRVVGCFRIASTDVAAPAQLWDRHSAVGCIAQEDFDRYYSGHTCGAAIQIASVQQLSTPLPLTAVLPSGVAPQSYVYLPPIGQVLTFQNSLRSR